MENKLHVGCCGFQKSQRSYYGQFKTIEIQQTFYKLPQVKTAQRWRYEAPHDFIFTLKALQLITHQPFSPTYRRPGREIPRYKWNRYGAFRPTDEVMQAWEDTRVFAGALQAPIVVFQCPPHFKPTTENISNMETFFSQVNRDDLLFAWEPRGGWPAEQVKELCQQLNLIHCVDAFQDVSVYGDPRYFRMHGRPDYNYKFTDGDLLQLLALCKQYPEVYCLFNNVEMWDDASRFLKILETDKLTNNQF
jgi:uncharacterized protein YecE (DUF72 family)